MQQRSINKTDDGRSDQSPPSAPTPPMNQDAEKRKASESSSPTSSGNTQIVDFHRPELVPDTVSTTEMEDEELHRKTEPPNQTGIVTTLLPPPPASVDNEDREDEDSSDFRVGAIDSVSTTDMKEEWHRKSESPNQSGSVATLLPPPPLVDNEDNEDYDDSFDFHVGAIAVSGLGRPVELEDSRSNTLEPSQSTPPNESLMVRATLVVDEAPEVTEEMLRERLQQFLLEQLQPVDAVVVLNEGVESITPTTKSTFWQNNKRSVVLLVALAIVTAVTVVLTVVMVSKNKHETMTPTTSTVPPSNRLDNFQTLLVQQNVSNENKFKDISTTQYKALYWLSYQDSFSLQQNDTVQVIERYIMAVLYFATKGGKWNQSYQFISSVSICNWNIYSGDQRVANNNIGVKCEEDHATHVSLAQNNLEGSIPGEIGKLAKLTRLSLWANNITGTLSMEIGLLQNLELLELSDNAMSGSLPTEISSLSKLTLLDMSHNILNGTLPAAIGNLHALRSFYLSLNSLTGTIPSEIGSLTNLNKLELTVNNFYGTLPSEIGNLTQLVTLVFGKNKFSGSIPSELGLLTTLTLLDLSGNNFNGTLPSEIAFLTQLELIDFSNNTFSGSIPSSLGQLSLLTSLRLDHNKLTGYVPSILANLSNLHTLNLAHNHFHGNLTTSFCNQGHNWSGFSADCRNNSNISCACCTCCVC